MRLTAAPTALFALLTSTLAYTATPSRDTDPQADGLIIEDITGRLLTCPRPTQNGDEILVHYRGSLLSTGEEFDASWNRGAPFGFTLGQGRVIKGWDQGLLDMCPGQSRKLTIPPALGYGDRGAGKAIPPGATLVFNTTLVEIIGINEEELLAAPSTVTVDYTVGTDTVHKPGTGFRIGEYEAFEVEHDPSSDPAPATETTSPQSDVAVIEEEQAECSLLGPFALLVQGALGGLALLTLVWKRWRETPKRPWKIFLFDVSKQVLGSMLTHVINLAMSMVSSVDMANAAAHVVSTAGAQAQDKDGRTPNPCSFYLLNLGIDTTLGVPVLYLLLIVLHALFLRTPLARPPQSIKSGNYGQPPKITWYGKQLLIYCIGLVGMKLFVFFLLVAMPWLPWIGDWALRWTKGNEKLEVAFALFVFPLAMNAVQYWVIDNLIMDKQKDGEGYEQVAEDETDETARAHLASSPGDATFVGSPDGDADHAKRVSGEMFDVGMDEDDDAETSSLQKQTVKHRSGDGSN